jgi:hypothetical protein
MSNDCQKNEVLKNHPGFGPGECEKQNQRLQIADPNPQRETCNL